MNNNPKAEARSRSGAEGADGEAKRETEKKRERLRLTDRDRQLVGLLAVVRYLSTGQLLRLLFSERSSINLSKRLLALAGEGKHGLKVPYLRRLTYRSRDGVLHHAWTLTRAGYALAESVLPAPVDPPAKEPGIDFIEHGLLLNELYVQLLEAPVRAALQQARERSQKAERPSRAMLRLKGAIYARAHHAGFRWRTHDASKLPWREYDLKAGKTRDRVILPDATLELLPREAGLATVAASGRRWFLEAETGSHTLVAQSDEKRGSTVAKLQQYAEFLTGRTDDGKETWYAKHHPDGLPPRVVFLVRTEARQQSVQKVIDAWTRETGSAVKAKVYTVEGAAAEFGRLLGAALPAPTRAPRTIVSAEVRLLKEFHASAVALATRMQPQGPTLPSGAVRVARLLDRLGGGA